MSSIREKLVGIVKDLKDTDTAEAELIVELFEGLREEDNLDLPTALESADELSRIATLIRVRLLPKKPKPKNKVISCPGCRLPDFVEKVDVVDVGEDNTGKEWNCSGCSTVFITVDQ